ncbi:Hypothetical_protein [Hexamita inflata]|uniref:Hypothetical_protein n=1 Tax=Hexamita inflata TaxID=28002 RepID=A0AA86P1Q2_9EUKA|nr:Hypothetical protein HINF_LOCUS17150 [Hexamita inflata]
MCCKNEIENKKNLWKNGAYLGQKSGNQQFVTFPNNLIKFSRQAEKRCSDEQKFEVFKIWNNKVLKSVRFRPNEINSTQFASWQSALIFFDSSLVTYHVNIFSGFLLELFRLAPFRVTGQTSAQLKRTQQILPKRV